MRNFEVKRRNVGHWDIWVDRGRAFRVRGAPTAYFVYDERNRVADPVKFRTVNACMGYICDELMHEIVATESQEVSRIEDWNL